MMKLISCFVNIIKIEFYILTLLFVSSTISFCGRLPNDSEAVNFLLLQQYVKPRLKRISKFFKVRWRVVQN